MHEIPVDLQNHEVEALSMGMGIVINPHHLRHGGKHMLVLHPTSLKKMHQAHQKRKHHLLKLKKGEGLWDLLKGGYKAVYNTVKPYVPKLGEHAGAKAGKMMASVLASKFDLDPQMAEEIGSRLGGMAGNQAGKYITSGHTDPEYKSHNIHHMVQDTVHKSHDAVDSQKAPKSVKMHIGGTIRMSNNKTIVEPPPPANPITQLGSPYARVNSPQMNPPVPLRNQNGGYNPLGKAVGGVMSGGSFAPAGGGGLHRRHRQPHYVSI
jgi:hypothetical protein